MSFFKKITVNASNIVCSLNLFPALSSVYTVKILMTRTESRVAIKSDRLGTIAFYSSSLVLCDK